MAGSSKKFTKYASARKSDYRQLLRLFPYYSEFGNRQLEKTFALEPMYVPANITRVI